MTAIRFEFRVDGALSEAARAEFVGMRITESTQTILDGDVIDQSHLHGLIAQLRAFGLTVESAHPIPGGR